jgi:formiminoglutamase
MEAAHWRGRVDGEPGTERWHQKVLALTPEAIDSGQPGCVLLGVASDIGVRRNEGRPGAEGGPDAIRAALANQAWHLRVPCYDAGNLCASGDDLEGLQREQADWVARLLDLGHFPLVLGGGHEIALGSFLGLRAHLERREQQGVIGVINFDAHFDLRRGGTATSGTSFLQMAERSRGGSLRYRYLCLGISEVANTRALFDTAKSLDASWLTDEQLASWNLSHAEEQLRDFVRGSDYLQLSIDLDVLPASVAPGVSAPAPRGVSLEVVEHLVQVIKGQGGGKLRIADLAECNPEYDVDGRTARVAARLCHLLAK